MIYLWTALLSILPISELRGGIPFALAHGVSWFIAWPFAAAVNALAAPGCWLFLSTAHRLFYGPPAPSGASPAETTGGLGWYRALFDRFVERARTKLRARVERWGPLGVALFVAIPLPVTGAWTGTLGAWILGLPKRRTLPAVLLGTAAAGGVVTLVTLLGIGALRVFVKAPLEP
ncbi:MAG: small multi-drug export protein [Treponema sp.]|jgi:uncharacterized membrane protein|nr:small multi-drug export protein [Treponema sp.]